MKTAPILTKAIEFTQKAIYKYGFCEIYIHSSSRFPLNYQQKCDFLDLFRNMKCTIVRKLNSHGIMFYSITATKQ